MKGFRFRAQAALDLRRREDEAATRVLAQAERALLDARGVLAAATGRLADARTQPVTAGTIPGVWMDGAWHRSWIVRLEQERRAAASRVREREGVVASALAARHRTYQRLESLERFRRKALNRFHDAEEAAERKVLDELGTMRFMAARRA